MEMHDGDDLTVVQIILYMQCYSTIFLTCDMLLEDLSQLMP